MGKIIEIKVVANAKTREVKEMPDGTLRVRTNKPRDAGRANEDVIALIAEHFDVAKSEVEIVSGFTATRKRVVVESERVR